MENRNDPVVDAQVTQATGIACRTEHEQPFIGRRWTHHPPFGPCHESTVPQADRGASNLSRSLATTLLPTLSFASETLTAPRDLTTTTGLVALGIFILAYLLVMTEEFTHRRKSKPVILATCLIWAMIALAYQNSGDSHVVEAALCHNLLEYAELMLFLLVAITYINAMDEHQVFATLRSWLIEKGFSLQQLYLGHRFFGHLKWTPMIALGYATSIAVHFWVNVHLFD